MKTSILSTSDEDIIQGLAPNELYANRHYLYAASCTQKQQLLGFQKFFEGEAVEELEHWQKWRDIANDYGFEIEMPSTKEVEFKDETIEGIIKASYDLELGLFKTYEKACAKAQSESVKVDIRKFIKIQRKSVGTYADLIAEIESVGVGFVNMRLLA